MNNHIPKFEDFVNEARITWGEELAYNLNHDAPITFVKAYEGQGADIFFTKDGRSAIVTQRMTNLVSHGKDSKSMNVSDVKFVYCGLEKEFYSPEDYKKLLNAVYKGSRNPKVKPMNINEAKEYTFSINYNTEDDDVEYISNLLMDAGVDAIAEPGIDSEEMIIKALNAIELRKAKKAIEKDGFEINEGAFHRLPSKVIGNDLYPAKQALNSFYDRVAAGNDVDPKTLDIIIKDLEDIKKAIKKFNNPKEIEGTVYEGLNEGAAKQFEVDYDKMTKNIKSGYGWIDPEYVGDTWENSSDTIDFEIVKDELYNRLIKAGLLFFADSEDEEKKGKKVTNISQIK